MSVDLITPFYLPRGEAGSAVDLSFTCDPNARNDHPVHTHIRKHSILQTNMLSAVAHTILCPFSSPKTKDTQDTHISYHSHMFYLYTRLNYLFNTGWGASLSSKHRRARRCITIAGEEFYCSS